MNEEYKRLQCADVPNYIWFRMAAIWNGGDPKMHREMKELLTQLVPLSRGQTVFHFETSQTLF